MGKLARRFRRELAASPKKAAVLGLLALVAMYYWTPLVMGWVSKRSDASEAGVVAAAPAAPNAAAAPAAPSPAPTKTAVPSIPWQQVIKLIENDERTLAAELGRLGRDPFAPKRAAAAKVNAQAQAAAAAESAAAQNAAASATPQGLGLTLSSTIIGADRRVARIGGRSYEQGQTIQVRKDGQVVGFLLAEVHARRAVLTRDGSKYELTIPDPRQSPKIELSRSE